MSPLVRLLPALLVAVVGIGLSFGAYRAADASERASQARAFKAISESTFREVELLLQRPVYGLLGLRGSLALAGVRVPDRSQLAAYVGARNLAAEFPNVLGMGVIVPVEAGAEAALVAAMRASGEPDFALRGESDASTRFVITGIAPREANLPAIGFDIGSEPVRRAAAERAMREGVPVLTGPIDLVQDDTQRPGALLMLPAFASGNARRTGPDDAVTALLYVALIYDDPYRETRNAAETGIRIRLLDDDALLFDSAPDAVPEPAIPMATHRIEAFGRRMAVEVQATPAFVARHPLGDASAVLWAGFALTGLTLLLVLQQMRLQRRAETLAEGMAGDLDRLAAVARLTDNAVAITDVEGRITWVNAAFEALTGFSQQEAKGRRPGALVQTPDTDQAQIAAIRAAIEARETYVGELLNRSKSGGEYWIRLEIQPMRDAAGNVTGFIGVQSDVTERREREAALRASQSLLDRTGEVSGTGGWRLDLRTNALSWTRTTYRIHAVPPGYVPDVANAIQFYAPEARPVIRKAIDEALATSGGWDLELPFVDYAGRRLWVRAVGEVVVEDGRAVALEGSFTDISSAVAARERIDLERQRLEMIIAGTGAGTWEWNVQTGETRFNQRWAEIIGQTLDELQPISIQTWLSHTHPDDLERSGELLEAHFRRESATYVCEARMRHKAGHWVWVLDRGRVMTWTADGKPEWMFGTHVDITERKESEARLAANAALLSTTLRSIGDAVVTADADGRISWLNPVAEALTGWTSEEAKGRIAAEVLDLQTEGSEGRAPCPIRACLDERRKVGLSGQTVLVSRGGERFFIEDSASLLRDGDGPVQGVVMVFHDVTEKAALAREMSHRARHDGLTGLVNRAEFELEAGRALERAHDLEQPGALMFLDLDHFKVVNDACGHAAGDEVLKQVAAILGAAVRTRDCVARLGGDEFAILLEKCPIDRARAIGERIVASIDAYRYSAEDGRRFRIGASVGLVPVDARWINLPQLLQGADAACYAAKSEGRGRLVAQEGVTAIAATQSRNVKWGPLIEQALDEDLFELHAQRIVPFAPEKPSRLRCEVLLRLRDTQGKLHGPGEFIPAAERYQLATRIDRWVLRAVLRTLMSEPGDHYAKVAVNLSGQSVSDRAFHRFAVENIRDSGVPPRQLCVEITETAVVTSFADAARFIEELRELGVQVALDDVGAGSSSFGYLKSLKVDLLKIDGQFVRGLLSGGLEAVAVRSFVDAASVLGIATVAEQVEDETVARALAELGVMQGQGYLFHRPEPFEKVLADSRNRFAHPSEGRTVIDWPRRERGAGPA